MPDFSDKTWTDAIASAGGTFNPTTWGDATQTIADAAAPVANTAASSVEKAGDPLNEVLLAGGLTGMGAGGGLYGISRAASNTMDHFGLARLDKGKLKEIDKLLADFDELPKLSPEKWYPEYVRRAGNFARLELPTTTGGKTQAGNFMFNARRVLTDNIENATESLPDSLKAKIRKSLGLAMIPDSDYQIAESAKHYRGFGGSQGKAWNTFLAEGAGIDTPYDIYNADGSKIHTGGKLYDPAGKAGGYVAYEKAMKDGVEHMKPRDVAHFDDFAGRLAHALRNPGTRVADMLGHNSWWSNVLGSKNADEILAEHKPFHDKFFNDVMEKLKLDPNNLPDQATLRDRIAADYFGFGRGADGKPVAPPDKYNSFAGHARKNMEDLVRNHLGTQFEQDQQKALRDMMAGGMSEAEAKAALPKWEADTLAKNDASDDILKQLRADRDYGKKRMGELYNSTWGELGEGTPLTMEQRQRLLAGVKSHRADANEFIKRRAAEGKLNAKIDSLNNPVRDEAAEKQLASLLEQQEVGRKRMGELYNSSWGDLGEGGALTAEQKKNLLKGVTDHERDAKSFMKRRAAESKIADRIHWAEERNSPMLEKLLKVRQQNEEALGRLYREGWGDLGLGGALTDEQKKNLLGQVDKHRSEVNEFIGLRENEPQLEKRIAELRNKLGTNSNEELLKKVIARRDANAERLGALYREGWGDLGLGGALTDEQKKQLLDKVNQHGSEVDEFIKLRENEPLLDRRVSRGEAFANDWKNRKNINALDYLPDGPEREKLLVRELDKLGVDQIDEGSDLLTKLMHVNQRGGSRDAVKSYSTTGKFVKRLNALANPRLKMVGGALAGLGALATGIGLYNHNND